MRIHTLLRFALLFPLLAYLMAGLLACAGGQASEAAIRLSLQDSGGHISLEKGQKLILTLTENPTTGYRWHIEKQDKGLLELSSDDYSEPDGARMGEGGTRQLVFTAVAPGSNVLELAYYRPWEGVENAGQWFQLIVDVRQ